MRLEADSIRRVAVLRALQLGDLLCAVPALRALRAAFGAAEITLIGLPWASQLVEHLPDYLDDFVAFPGWPGLPEQPFSVAAVPAFLSAMQQRCFDLAIQMHGNGTLTNAIVALSGARMLAGFYRPGEWVPSSELYMPYPDEGPEVYRLLSLVERLGCASPGTALDFAVHSRDRARLADLELGSYVCLHPGARDTTRRVSVAAMARIGDALAHAGLTVVLTGAGPVETSLAGQVATAMHHACRNLVGQTSLGELAALLQGARLLVCADTGVSHLAAAVRTASVVVFTTSDPHRWAPLDTRLHHGVLAASASDLVATVLRHADSLLETRV